jgi:hypothetical protein
MEFIPAIALAKLLRITMVGLSVHKVDDLSVCVTVQATAEVL